MHVVFDDTVHVLHGAVHSKDGVNPLLKASILYVYAEVVYEPSVNDVVNGIAGFV